ncbi:sporulation histidine kinase inhibitor Sda [Salinibacillus xinjiangensis]
MNDEKLEDAYKRALDLQLDHDFVNILKEEMRLRNERKEKTKETST